MTISEMHVWFRQYAQQMGMQNVRAILPEQIDNLINTSNKDVIDEIINKNIGTTNDRVITDNNKLANINALRTLYKVKTIPVGDTKTVSEYGNNPYYFTSNSINDALYFLDFSIRYSNTSDAIAQARKQYILAINGYILARDIYTASPKEEYKTSMSSMYDILIKRQTALKTAIEQEHLTRWFPIRIVDDSYLADILNDWILAPRMRTPVMVIYSTDINNGNSQFELYVGENNESGVSAIASTKYIAEIRCSYIKTPNKVAYLSDVGGNNVNSDLPEQLQIPMLKHAVDLYRVSIQGSLYANQQNAQQNQQEIARNNARPDNEGYQS